MKIARALAQAWCWHCGPCPMLHPRGRLCPQAEWAVPALTTGPVHAGLDGTSFAHPELQRLKNSPQTGEGHSSARECQRPGVPMKVSDLAAEEPRPAPPLGDEPVLHAGRSWPEGAGGPQLRVRQTSGLVTLDSQVAEACVPIRLR